MLIGELAKTQDFQFLGNSDILKFSLVLIWKETKFLPQARNFTHTQNIILETLAYSVSETKYDPQNPTAAD